MNQQNQQNAGWLREYLPWIAGAALVLLVLAEAVLRIAVAPTWPPVKTDFDHGDRNCFRPVPDSSVAYRRYGLAGEPVVHSVNRLGFRGHIPDGRTISWWPSSGMTLCMASDCRKAKPSRPCWKDGFARGFRRIDPRREPWDGRDSTSKNSQRIRKAGTGTQTRHNNPVAFGSLFLAIRAPMPHCPQESRSGVFGRLEPA